MQAIELTTCSNEDHILALVQLMEAARKYAVLACENYKAANPEGFAAVTADWNAGRVELVARIAVRMDDPIVSLSFLDLAGKMHEFWSSTLRERTPGVLQ